MIEFLGRNTKSEFTSSIYKFALWKMIEYKNVYYQTSPPLIGVSFKYERIFAIEIDLDEYHIIKVILVSPTNVLEENIEDEIRKYIKTIK